MSEMVLSGQSCSSAQALATPVKGKQPSGQRAGPVRILVKQPSEASEQAAEHMVMSGDMGSQVCLNCLSPVPILDLMLPGTTLHDLTKDASHSCMQQLLLLLLTLHLASHFVIAFA